MSTDQVIGFVIALLAMLVGLAGAILPGLPGTPLVFVAALAHKLWFADRGVSWWVLSILGLLMGLSLLVDLLATSTGAKKLGATWRGMVGAVLGAMIGLMFVPIGLIIGPFLGASLLEALGGRDWRESSKAGFGATLGFLAGTVGRVACCVAMIGLFVLSALLNFRTSAMP